MLFESFKSVGLAVGQIFLLGAIGYFLVKKNILGEEGLDALSRLTIDVTLPLLIFCQLIQGFNFRLYSDWWIFPIISIAITILGLITGSLFSNFISDKKYKRQFVSLVTFQNSGYLPLALIIALLPQEAADRMCIYLFLLLSGFNLLMWSFGVHLLTFTRKSKFELASLFSPPVIATLVSLVLIFFWGNNVLPAFVLKPLRMIGDCTLPLAMLVVGGSLAQITLDHIDIKAIFWLLLAKLVALPLFGLWLVLKFKFPQLVGLLILIQLAMPSATSWSVITRHYHQEDLLISQGIFFTHLVSMATLPVFLSLYFHWGMLL